MAEPEQPPTSPRLMALRRQVEAGDQRALDAFWGAMAEEGTPLVEPLEGDDASVLVTFLWRASEGLSNVRILNDDVLGRTPAENAMTNLEGTDVWHRTYRLRSDLRFEYLLGPNDPELGRKRAKPGDDPAASWQIDPHNPRQYHLPDDGEHPEWEKSFAGSTWVRRTNSLVELPDAPPQPWIARTEALAGRVDKHRLESAILGGSRAVYVYVPPGEDRSTKPPELLILFDGWLYHQIVPTPTILDNLLAAGAIPPHVAVLVDHPTLPIRDDELSFDSVDSPFVAFLSGELMPWVRARYRVIEEAGRVTIGGASNGGDIAALAAFRHPHLFGKVLSQSGTFGRRPKGDPEPEWLARTVAADAAVPVRFHLEAGLLETRPGDSGLSILQSNRHLRTVLRAKGYPVDYVEFGGGHQPLCWRGTLPEALIALAARPAAV